MNDFNAIIQEFKELTKQYDDEVSKELKGKKYTHWIDGTKELLSRINERQRRHILSLDLIRLELITGAELFIDKDKNILFYGCKGIGIYSVGYVRKGIAKLLNKEIISIYGGYNPHRVIDKPGIEYSYMTPTIYKSHLKGDREFIDELFTLN